MRTDDRGAVAGAEALVLGALVLVVGTLVLAQAWAVIDVRTALDDASREYVRTYGESSDGAAGSIAAAHAATTLLDQRGTPLRSLRIDPPDTTRFGPCTTATVHLRATVPALRLPFGLRFGAVEVHSSHTESIDPHREVRSGPRYDPDATPCAAF